MLSLQENVWSKSVWKTAISDPILDGESFFPIFGDCFTVIQSSGWLRLFFEGIHGLKIQLWLCINVTPDNKNLMCLEASYKKTWIFIRINLEHWWVCGTSHCPSKFSRFIRNRWKSWVFCIKRFVHLHSKFFEHKYFLKWLLSSLLDEKYYVWDHPVHPFFFQIWWFYVGKWRNFQNFSFVNVACRPCCRLVFNWELELFFDFESCFFYNLAVVCCTEWIKSWHTWNS